MVMAKLLEVGYTIYHHLPQWWLMVILGSKIKYSKYRESNNFFNLSISFLFYNGLANTYRTFQSYFMTR